MTLGRVSPVNAPSGVPFGVGTEVCYGVHVVHVTVTLLGCRARGCETQGEGGEGVREGGECRTGMDGVLCKSAVCEVWVRTVVEEGSVRREGVRGGANTMARRSSVRERGFSVVGFP